jgi:biopolymer transport protein ExbB/TolQ
MSLPPVADLLLYPTLLALVLMSILALGIGLERVVYAWQQRRCMRRGKQAILAHLREGKPTMAQAVNTTSPVHAATKLFELLLEGALKTRMGELKRGQSSVLRRAKKRLWVLGSIASIAPFVGLMGTVIGVMQAFSDIGAQGGGGFEVVSAGISEALVTTAAGIFVGVEAVLLFNYLKVCLADYAAELRDALDEIADFLPEAAHGAERP